MSTISSEDIQDFLIDSIAEALDIDENEIDVIEPVSNYGLTSLMALALVEELQTFLGKKIEATVLWNYPTIDAITKFLTKSED